MIAITGLILGILSFIFAEQSRKDLNLLVNRFITEQGQPLSLFALPYLGRPTEAREAILHTSGLQRLRLAELYTWSIVLFVLSIWQVFL